ncbi:ribose transport system ATP-binding protein [Aequitasia blattaphilus]|uniref:Sugar ABC transporter ATP-binding protein n=1 Tax=Aequitasia blattaphilus TaxID=2949332 RepID=A0ABT1EB78_9FIRM|nr:sugar ABC transporter ATP-binding protein [Aequitasia blattaphilus]MCP1102111.1 sugar ABC transporter ATP-binding protein [Aequitasia blattaphilus]MCR8614751.1 sugar ABC transporter ATP-binding protein [Aequitasia blattaphilus]
MTAIDNILEIKSISKFYPGVTALKEVSFDVRRGEVHALIGENGAGKSTLIKTCSGAISPSEGKIVVNGESFECMTPKLSEKKGIGVIYQEFNLVGDLSVAENIFLGRAIRSGIVIDQKAMEKEAKRILGSLNIDIDPRTLVKKLSVGYQQMVEIAKAVSQNAQILIMDEPSAPLTNAEVESMFAIVDQLKKNGVTIIYISHRLDEIFRLSDRVTILRDGQYVTTLNTRETDKDELVRYMVGRELTEIYPERSETCIKDEVIFEAVNVSGNGDKNISFQLHKGEVLGFGGLVGAGRTELAELIFGMEPKQDGKFILNGKEIAPKNPKAAINHGIGLVPEDRKTKGALLGLSIKENINMPIYPRISKGTVIDTKKEYETADKYKNEISIKTPNLSQLVKNLSGGNQQKVILAKWLAADVDLLIFDEPTRGIDVGAKQEIYMLINSLVEQGKAVLMISSEMEELMGMSDRIIILSEGCITGELNKDEYNQETIMRMASVERKG